MAGAASEALAVFPGDAVAWLWRCPFRLDVHQRSRLRPKTLSEYSRQAVRFQRWYGARGILCSRGRRQAVRWRACDCWAIEI